MPRRTPSPAAARTAHLDAALGPAVPFWRGLDAPPRTLTQILRWLASGEE